jgi:hypothetical protein
MNVKQFFLRTEHIMEATDGVLWNLDGVLCDVLASLALQPQHNLLCGLCLNADAWTRSASQCT